MTLFMLLRPFQTLFFSPNSNRIRSLRNLIFFSFFNSSMETTSFPYSIDTIGENSLNEFGFNRSEFGHDSLAGTVQFYDRHVFLRYRSPEFWPPNVEKSDSESLPRLLAAAMKNRKEDLKKKTRLTICGEIDNTDTSSGDVLIFPERIGYRRLTDADIDKFVDLVLVKETEWLPQTAETLEGSYVFVCAHGSRDQRCGVCGPILIEKFKKEISLRGLEGQVFVSPCSHIGGHKYAGNVIIFSQSKTGETSGNWYGYVSPDEVPMLLEQQIAKGEIIDHLWRGQMGLSVEEQRKAQSIRLQPNITNREDKASGCCQGNSSLSCCQNGSIMAKPDANHTDNVNAINPSSSYAKKKKFGMPTWFKQPERDVFAALAVVAAVTSVATAFFFYRNRK